MSTTEEELADEKQAQEESGATQNGDEESHLGDEAQMDEGLAQGKTPNASVLSASEIRGVDSDEITTEPHPADAHDAKNGLEANESKTEEAEADPTSNGVEDDWEDILGNGQLMKKVLGKGAGLSTRPTPQCRVKVRTRGYLESGKVVDRHSAISFTVGEGDVPQAWDLVVPLMEKGETAKVKTNSRFAYGSLGKPPDIPPEANITYELELLDVQPPLNYETIAEEELLKLVDQKRVRGNELFQRKEYDRAINSYQKGLNMLENFLEEVIKKIGQQTQDSEQKTVQEMQIRCLNNLAAAQLKVELHKEALKSCEDVLQKDPNNVKALFRAGKVLSIMGEMDQAVRKLEKAKSLDSEERAIQTELEKAQQKRKVTQDKERQMCRRMMEGGKSTKQQNKVAKPSISSWGPLPYLAVAAIVASIGIGLAYFITQKH